MVGIVEAGCIIHLTSSVSHPLRDLRARALLAHSEGLEKL